MESSPNSTSPNVSEPVSTMSLEALEQDTSTLQPSVKINLMGHEDPSLGITSDHTQDKPFSQPRNIKSWRPKLLIGLISILIIAGIGTGSYLLLPKQKAARPIGVNPEKIDPPTFPAKPPVAEPTPPPTPPAELPVAPTTVSTPAVTPTADHPQTVMVQSKSGLWLRSTPDSSNRKNIIGWMPNGAEVAVDQIGVFWWHGTYKGTTGYFANNYTQ